MALKNGLTDSWPAIPRNKGRRGPQLFRRSFLLYARLQKTVCQHRATPAWSSSRRTVPTNCTRRWQAERPPKNVW